MFSCFMHDCLTHLSNLSASMQQPSLTVAEVQTSLIATQAVLTKHKNRPGPRLRACLENPADTFEGVTLAAPRDDLSLARVNSTKDKLIDKFCSSMATRFCDFSSGVLHASKLVDITSWPDADTCEDFGDAYVECLISTLVHYWPPLGRFGSDSRPVDIPQEQFVPAASEHGPVDLARDKSETASVRARMPDFMERGAKKRKTQLEDEKETSEEEDDDSEED
ncbi:uncharacterized protein LOC116034055 [Sander lucioperca]|uniref:uncharacterized protein LOC116034055 n=1 Tax=Sander lucioperca TaxID=283035 RepID=UPI0016538527|nr:uncharacterized protein LOC116034055 [Sander lucioperca]